MSEPYFLSKFTYSINEILDLIQLEQLPSELDQNKKVISENWSCKDFLTFYIGLYFRYIKTLSKIEDSYNQLINPQLRTYIKKFLEAILTRIVQIKKEIVFYNNPILTLPGILYVFLDDYLIDMKKEPRDLDIVIPNYFKEDNSELTQQRKALISKQLTNIYGNDKMEEEIYDKFFQISIKFEEAIVVFQNFEMGRQGLRRVDKIIKDENKKLYDNDIGSKVIIGEDESKKLVIENIIAHYKLKNIRYNEYELLKMIPKIESVDYIEIANEIREERKKRQGDEYINYGIYKKSLVDRFKKIEEEDFKENLKNERREWLTNYIKEHSGEPPVFIKDFYKRNEVEKKEELDDNQKKVQENIAKDKLKKEQDSKKKDEAGQFIKLPVFSGGSGEVSLLGKYIQEFSLVFDSPSEYIQSNEYHSQMARDEIINDFIVKIKADVDLIIQNEITNLRKIFLKGKKDVAAKLPKEKLMNKEKLGPGENKIKTTPAFELLLDSVNLKVYRHMIDKSLDDLICDFNYIANSLQLVDSQMIDVPLFYTKQLIKELIIFPLGCKQTRTNGKINSNSFLFHGPPGSGKTHAALAVKYHTDALFFDVSPRNLERFKSKDELTKAFATAFRTARTYQPAIFYFDSAEEIFPIGKLPKGVKKNPNAVRLKKLLITYKSLITLDMRIMFIGCSNKPQLLNQKDYVKMFDKSLFFGYPSSSDRSLLWKKEISSRIGYRNDIEYDVLSQMSMNFSWESIVNTINYTLTPIRLERSKFDPVRTEEFVSYLSKTDFLFKEDLIGNRDFLYFSSGLKSLHEYLNMKKLENDKGKKK